MTQNKYKENMIVTRIKVGEINGKMEIVDKQAKIIDNSSIFYLDNDNLPITDDDISSGRVKHIGCGFTALKEYICMKEEPQIAEDPKVSVSIRIPLSYATKLRATGRGWQTRLSDFLIKGVKQGAFDDVTT
jgi:hypothetical protein